MKRFLVRSPAQGLKTIKHPAITRNYERSLRWRPKHKRAVLLPCASVKPFSASASHASGYLPALEGKPHDRFVVSEPLGVVPYAWEQTWPNDAYDFPPEHLRGPARDELVRRIAAWWGKVGSRYERVFLALPEHHRRLVLDALEFAGVPAQAVDVGQGACLDAGGCPPGHYRATSKAYQGWLRRKVNPGADERARRLSREAATGADPEAMARYLAQQKRLGAGSGHENWRSMDEVFATLEPGDLLLLTLHSGRGGSRTVHELRVLEGFMATPLKRMPRTWLENKAVEPVRSNLRMESPWLVRKRNGIFLASRPGRQNATRVAWLEAVGKGQTGPDPRLVPRGSNPITALFGSAREPVEILGPAWPGHLEYWDARLSTGEEGYLGAHDLYTPEGKRWLAKAKRNPAPMDLLHRARHGDQSAALELCCDLPTFALKDALGSFGPHPLRLSSDRASMALHAYYRAMGYRSSQYGSLLAPDGSARLMFKKRVMVVQRPGRKGWVKAGSVPLVSWARGLSSGARMSANPPLGEESWRRAVKKALAPGASTADRERAELETARREGRAWRSRVPVADEPEWDSNQDPLLIVDNDGRIYDARRRLERWLLSRLILGDFNEQESIKLWERWARSSRDFSDFGRHGLSTVALQANARFLDQARHSWTEEELEYVLARPLVAPGRVK